MSENVADRLSREVRDRFGDKRGEGQNAFAVAIANLSKQRLDAGGERIPGTSRGMVQRYLSGETDPPLAFLRAAAELLNVREEWLILGKGGRTEEEDRQVRRILDAGKPTDRDRLIQGLITDGGSTSTDELAEAKFYSLSRYAGKAERDAAVDSWVLTEQRSHALLRAAASFLDAADKALAQASTRAQLAGGPPLIAAPASMHAGEQWYDALLLAFWLTVPGMGAPTQSAPAE